MLHYLHIGKTGGSTIKAALKDCGDLVVLHRHATRLRDVPVGQKVFFCIRHPVPRFVSGFNSRLRMGRPRLNKKWSPDEARAFAIFRTPDALAVALSARDEGMRTAAIEAMAALRHATPLTEWFSIEELKDRAADIACILWQDKLTEDFARAKRLLALPADITLPTDEVATHKTPQGFSTTLSEEGEANIRRWYRNDLPLFRHCREMRREIFQRARAAV